ncbi:MAG: coenzyme F430 synthase [Methanomicrobiales archaeon]|nr:coenzyme F430 synthase [Methanomicrobiales archaeon]
MDILVLDTIHGGLEIARQLEAMGHAVDAVDVYRGKMGPVQDAYDLIVAPVHLDPGHPYLSIPAKRIVSHHEAVAWILWDCVPHPMVEITGARGKTTTAHALASICEGPGVLHTSQGTFSYPDRTLLWKRSITPASVIPAAREARACGGWLIAEESLGVTGAGDLAIITSAEDYPIGAGKKSGLSEKLRLVRHIEMVVAPRALPGLDRIVTISQVTRCMAESCLFSWQGREGMFSNPLLVLEGYRTPLRLAATAACLLGINPVSLGKFHAVGGRMAVERSEGRVIVDNANSGTDRMTTIEAAHYARSQTCADSLTLVIGEVSRTICEGFSAEEVEETIRLIQPEHVILVGDRVKSLSERFGYPHTNTLDEGQKIARNISSTGGIVLAVKCWR